jgi:hypothetical protein
MTKSVLSPAITFSYLDAVVYVTSYAWICANGVEDLLYLFSV